MTTPPLPSQSDSMTNIERWTIKACPECGRVAGNFCYGPRTNEHPRASVVEVEVVRADACEGAVEEIARLRQLLTDAATLFGDLGHCGAARRLRAAVGGR